MPPPPPQPPQGDRNGFPPRQNNQQRVMHPGQESANLYANSNRGSGSYHGNSGHGGSSNHQPNRAYMDRNFNNGNVPMNVPVFDNRNRSSQGRMALQDHIPPQQHNNGRGGNGRGNFRGQHHLNNIPSNNSSRSNAAQGNNMSMNQSFANQSFSNNQMNGQGRGRGNHQGYQHPNGSYQQNNYRRGRNYSDAGQPSQNQNYNVQQYADRGRSQRRGNVPHYSNDVSRHHSQPSNQDQHNTFFGYGREPHRGSNGGGNRNSVDMNKSFAVPQCYQDGDDSVFHDEDGPSTSDQHNRGRRKNSYRKGNKQRNMNKSFGGYMQQDNGSSGHPYRQEAHVQLSENVPVVVQHPINMHQIVPTEEVPTEQMKELVINPKPKKSSRSRRKNKKRANLNATMPEQELDETHNGSVNMNQTIGCSSTVGILKRRDDDRPKRSKSVIFGSPPTPRALWSEERTLHSTGLGLRQRASQNANDSICVVDADEEDNCNPSWKNTAVIHVSQVIKTKSDARFVGLYLAHRGIVTPMPDIIVKNGKVIFVLPNTIVLKKMPSNFLFNLYPSEGHKKGQLLAGRYYYADNNQIAGGTKSLPNKYTISNFPEQFMDVNMYNAEVKSKMHMDMVLKEFITPIPIQEPPLVKSVLGNTDLQMAHQVKAKEESKLETTTPAEPSSHVEPTAVLDQLPILTKSPVCRSGPKPLPRPNPFPEPVILVKAPLSEAVPIPESTTQIQVPVLQVPSVSNDLPLLGFSGSRPSRPLPMSSPKPIAEVELPMTPMASLVRNAQVTKGESETKHAQKPVEPLDIQTVGTVVETTNTTNMIAVKDVNRPTQNVGPSTQDAKTPAKDGAVDPNYVTPTSRSGKKRSANFTPVTTSTPRKSRAQEYDSQSAKKPRCSNTSDDGLVGYESPSVDPSVAGPSAKAPPQVRRSLRSLGLRARRQRNSTGIPLPLDLENDAQKDSCQKATDSPAN